MSSQDKRTSYNRPLTTEEEERIMKAGSVLAVTALIFMAGFALLVHNELVGLYPSSMNAEVLKGFAARIEFALRYQTLLVFWLTFNVLITIYGRITVKALNPLDERGEQKVQIFKNILTNSLESIVVSVFSQFIFVSFASPPTILKYIPLVNIIQFIGRVTFFAGYPLYRSFGFTCTLFPNIVLNLYNVYKLGSFLGIY